MNIFLMKSESWITPHKGLKLDSPEKKSMEEWDSQISSKNILICVPKMNKKVLQGWNNRQN